MNDTYCPPSLRIRASYPLASDVHLHKSRVSIIAPGCPPQLAVAENEVGKMKKLFPITALLGCSLFLSGCMIRMTGPCLGYGCPAGTSSENAYSVRNTTKPSATVAKNATASSSSTAAKNAPSQSAQVHTGN
jgi:hypothetical protein